MRRTTLLLAAACFGLHALATWSAFHGGPLLTSFLALAGLACLLALLVVLCRRGGGDWAFRLPLLLAGIGYLLFIGYWVWDLLTSFD